MKKFWTYFKMYATIVICAVLFGLSYHIFIFPNEFAPAGIPGIATMIQYIFGFKVGYMNIIVNIPLLLLTFFIIGKKYTVRSAVFSAVSVQTVMTLPEEPVAVSVQSSREMSVTLPQISSTPVTTVPSGGVSSSTWGGVTST